MDGDFPTIGKTRGMRSIPLRGEMPGPDTDKAVWRTGCGKKFGIRESMSLYYRF